MEPKTKKIDGANAEITATLTQTDIDANVERIAKQLSKDAKIDGFRKGKVPPNVLQKLFGKEARARAASNVMQSKYFEAVMQQQLNPVGMPTITPMVNEEGKDLQFAATFEVYPEVTVQALDKLKIEKPDVTVTDADVDTMLETLRKQHGGWKEVKRKPKKSERITIDFVGSIDGVEFAGGKAADFALELGQGRMIPGFEDQVIGMKSGEEKTIEVTFPADYHADDLKGKVAQFVITAKKVEQRELPELNDDFVALFGITDGGVQAWLDCLYRLERDAGDLVV